MKRFSQIVALALMGVLATACTRIGPGHVGVKVSMAGDKRGVDEIPTTTGWVFYNPFLTSVYEWPTNIQTVNLENEEGISFQSEKMTIGANISYAYSLDASKVPHFYVRFRSDDLKAFSHGYLRSLIRDKFNELASTRTIDEITSNTGTFLAAVREAVQKEVAPYGVVLDNQFGFIGPLHLPDNITASINQRVQADQIALQKQKEIQQVEADMAKERTKTDTYARNRIAAAEAEAQAIKIVAQANQELSRSLTPAILQKQWIEKWQGQVPQVSGAGSGLLLNLTPKD